MGCVAEWCWTCCCCSWRWWWVLPEATVAIGSVEVPLSALKAALRSDMLRAQLSLPPADDDNDVARAIADNVRSILPLLKDQQRFEMGRQALAIVMVAAVLSEGDIANARYMRYLNINDTSIAAARQRRRAWLAAAAASMSPQQALGNGDYLYQERRARCDAFSPEMVSIMRDFWHDSSVSRTSVNSKETKKASRHKGAEEHGVHRQFISGEGVRAVSERSGVQPAQGEGGVGGK
eukprot:TRINITY_DN655_c0_g1_i3.p2 TRINITY_DN655_c0_g1~~TRINITY_DN655_c0_g1_i3.p2  ORF type:complete len:235 (-),score=44.35 TRINITY_DN655_c0_g1_i3:1697-2401(-)